MRRFVESATAFVLSRLWIRRVSGLENIPKAGSLLVVSNHASYFDFFILTYAILKIRKNATIYFLATKELLSNPLLRFYMRLRITDCVPIDRGKPGVGFFKESMKVLKNGNVLIVFPEGTRSLDGNLGQWKLGAIKLAAMAKAAVVPVALINTFKILPKGRPIPTLEKCTVKMGKPCFFKYDANGKVPEGDLIEANERLYENVKELMGVERQQRIQHKILQNMSIVAQ